MRGRKLRGGASGGGQRGEDSSRARQRETGFNTMWSGANVERARRLSDKPGQVGAGRAGCSVPRGRDDRGQRPRQRARWGEGKLALTRDGIAWLRRSVSLEPGAGMSSLGGGMDTGAPPVEDGDDGGMLEELSLRIRRLSATKHSYLLSVLEELESADSPSLDTALLDEGVEHNRRYGDDDDGEEWVEGECGLGEPLAAPPRSSSPVMVGGGMRRHLCSRGGEVSPLPVVEEERPLSGQEDPDNLCGLEHMSPSQTEVFAPRPRLPEHPSPFDSLAHFNLNHLGRIGGDSPKMNHVSGAPGCASDDMGTRGEAEPPADVGAESFRIPRTPSGRELALSIHTTWGDPHYVGLMGVEVFDAEGTILPASDMEISGDPHSINVLPEYTEDPRTVDNLLDGVNASCDDLHSWLAPFTEGKLHVVSITFRERVTLGMVRVWNYNKSRIHSLRGARYVEMSLDGGHIFKGEIVRAPGTLRDCELGAECILFTTDDAVLARIEQWDTDTWRAQLAIDVELVPEEPPEDERPRTAGQQRGATSRRPPTAAGPCVRADPSPPAQPAVASEVRVSLLESWGDPDYVGLTGVGLVAWDGSRLPLHADMLSCDPPNVRVPPLAGLSPTAQEDIGVLVDGSDLTCDGTLMWAVPMVPITSVIISLGRPTALAALLVWNYNYPDLLCCGVKRAAVFLDRKPMCSHGIFLRKAPGSERTDFGQTVPLVPPGGPHPLMRSAQKSCVRSSILNSAIVDAIRQAHRAICGAAAAIPEEAEAMSYIPLLLPTACTFRLEILSTHGDRFYVGLNGLEMRDAGDQPIDLSPANLEAVPRDVTVLPECASDVRTLDKLVDGVHDVLEDAWLAPFKPGVPTVLLIMFEAPVALSLLRVWNYVKTPSRGAREVMLFADDRLIYKGILSPAPDTPEGGAHPQSIPFTLDPKVLSREHAREDAADAPPRLIDSDASR